MIVDRFILVGLLCSHTFSSNINYTSIKLHEYVYLIHSIRGIEIKYMYTFNKWYLMCLLHLMRVIFFSLLSFLLHRITEITHLDGFKFFLSLFFRCIFLYIFSSIGSICSFGVPYFSYFCVYGVWSHCSRTYKILIWSSFSVPFIFVCVMIRRLTLPHLFFSFP